MNTLQSSSIFFSEKTLDLLHLPGGNAMDLFMILITRIGTAPLYIAVLLLIFHFADRRRGTVLIWLYLLSSAFNGILKTLFFTARPDPALLIHGDLAGRLMPHSPSFPSGHAQGAMVFFGSLMILFPGAAIRITCVAMIILVSYSRLYLGVHFPGDIAGGWLAGSILLFLTGPAFALERITGSNRHPGVAAMLVLGLMLPSVFVPVGHLRIWTGLLAGFTMGLFHATGEDTTPRIELSLKTIIPAAGILLLTLLLSLPAKGTPFLFFTMCLTGYWMSRGSDIIAGIRKYIRGQER